ncbi:MAG TPA: cupin domain-containing protein, partial [Pseudolabrys sp.]|nr:cupin domain-containing protein [Pseudolabrys sp.]
MPKIDIDKIAFKPVGGYPGPFKKVLDKREKKQLGDAVGLTQFGVNIPRLGVGGASSLRHWHREEDEFIYILEGEVVLIEDA